MNQRFANKVVIVTGAGSGIGRATAIEFAGEGARLMVADRNVESGRETLDLVRQGGGEASFFEVDVARAASVEALVAATLATYGRLDVAFNNAGISQTSRPLAEVDDADFDRLIAVNLRGVFLCMKHEIRAMLKGGGGAIVNTASVGGQVAAPELGAYVASKHGVVGLTRAAAIDYAAKGIRINAVSPGATATPMLAEWTKDPAIVKMLNEQHPIGRYAQAREIARVVLFLASSDASFVVGHSLLVDGGLVCL